MAPAAVVQDTVSRRQRRPVRAGLDSLKARPDSTPPDSLAEAQEPFPQPDSVMEALMKLQGYRPVVYHGDTLQFSTRDRSLRIRERANIQRAGDELFAADSVVYESGTNFLTAYGESKLINAKGEEVNSEVGPLYYHTERKIGTVVGGRTQWDVWHVAGNFTLEGSDTLWVKSGRFTSCDLPEPHYRFEADKIKLVLNRIVVAWPVRLYFGEVPVFWFPFMAQDIRKGRHSGILTLRFGINDVVRNSSSHNRHISNIGYYWAISDYMDTQLSLDWWSDTWTRLDGFFRYRWRQKFINGQLGYSQFFLPEGGRQTSLAWNHSQQFGERANLRASVSFVSSRTFQRESEFNPERLTQNIRSNIGYTRRFDWGNLSLSGQRVQPLSEGEATTTTLPQFSLTLSPIVLTPARSPLEARWYNGLTWTGSTNFSFQATEPPVQRVVSRDTVVVGSDTTITGFVEQPNRFRFNGGLTSGISLGAASLNSNASYAEEIIDKPDTLIVSDTTVVAPDTTIVQDTTVIGSSVRSGTLNWNVSTGYRQRLIGSTTLTPSLALSGTMFRSNETDLSFVSAPTRVSVNASLNSDIYGFFPGVGPLSRIRHKLTPTFSWSYSPSVKPSAELQGLRGFSAAESRERNQLTLTLSQTFEAKLKPREEPPEADTARATAETPRQAPQERKITLLAVRTSSVLYDFVDGRVTTTSVSNNVTSDLLRGLNLRVDHDLFRACPRGEDLPVRARLRSRRQEPVCPDKPGGGREFDLFLRQLNLSFSIGDRTLAAIGASRTTGIERERGIVPEAQGFDEQELEQELPQEDRGPRDQRESRPSRPWNLSIDYSLVRQRERPGLPPEQQPENRQSVRANLGFSPTENWTLSWRTQYDIEGSRFIDHALSLRRDLHRWSATFQFLKAANGNFLFDFRVNLNDLPDVKFDWRQEDRR